MEMEKNMDFEVPKDKEWELTASFNDPSMRRLKIDGGYIHQAIYEGSTSICFVPDIDLSRYQSHLRDAYKKGYEDGMNDMKKS